MKVISIIGIQIYLSIILNIVNLQLVNAAESRGQLTLSFTVPIVCDIINHVPVCNLELTQTESNVWIDNVRNVTIRIENNQLVIEGNE